jgi:hypothetical protein
MLLTEEQICNSAREVSQWLQDAVSDLAFGTTYEMLDQKWQKKIEEAKWNGVTDLKGWLADEFYNDISTLCDLSGDRIHDLAGPYEMPDHAKNKIAIAKKIKETANRALTHAMEEHIARWNIDLDNRRAVL